MISRNTAKVLAALLAYPVVMFCMGATVVGLAFAFLSRETLEAVVVAFESFPSLPVWVEVVLHGFNQMMVGKWAYDKVDELYDKKGWD